MQNKNHKLFFISKNISILYFITREKKVNFFLHLFHDQ